MDNATSRTIQFTSFLLCILLCIGLSSSSTVAASFNSLQVDSDITETVSGESGSQKFFSAVAVFHSFTAEQMKDAYGQMYGGLFMGGLQLASGVGWRIESGLLIAVGDPRFPDSSWEVESSSMQTAVLPLGGSVLYRFSGSERGRTFVPYVGLGLDGYFGFERTSVKISRSPEGVFDWNDSQYRQTFGVHAIIGMTFRLTEKVSGLLEIRWTQGADGSHVDHSFSEEEIDQGWLEVVKAVQRPDFNFTGLSVSLGARW